MNRKITKLIIPVLVLTALLFGTIIPGSAAGTVSFTKQPADAVVYAGDSVSLSVSTTGGNQPTYQWFKNTSDSTASGSKIPGATANKYTPSTKYTGTYYYYCKVYSIGTTITTLNSETACVLVKALPAITAQPVGTTVYTGESASLSVTASGSGTLSYQWYSNTTKSAANALKISNAVNPTYAAPTTAAGTMYYFCVVTNTDSAVTASPERAVTSSIAKVVVNALSVTEPTITTQPSPVTVYAGTSAKLSVAAAAGGTLSYQWYRNETGSTAGATAIIGASGSFFQLPTDTVGTVYYYCVVTNTVAAPGTETYQKTSNVVACSVKAVTVISAQPAGTNALVGDTVKLSVTATGSGTLSYQWYTNTTGASAGGSKISGAVGSSYTVPTKNTGTAYYYCVVTNHDNAITSSVTTSTAISNAAQVIVLVSSATAPTITAQPVSASVYAGTVKKLTVAASGNGTLSYQWYSNLENSTVNGTAINGAVDSTFIALNTTAGTIYYYCVVTNTSDTASGPQAVTAVSAVASMVARPLPSISSQPADSSIYSGNKLTLTVTATGSGTLSYQWFKNTTNKASGTKINGATGSSYTVPSSAVGTMYYYCIVTNLDSSITDTKKTAAVTSSVAKVTVVSPDADAPKITKNPTGATVMAGDAATLTVTATGSGSLSYQWYSNTKQSTTGAALVIGATGSTYAVPTAAGGRVYYFCQVTNTDSTKPRQQTAAVFSNPVLVTVNTKEPAILKQPASVHLYTLSSYSISVTASGCGTLSYQWYSNTKEDNSSGTAIPGATSARLLIPTETAGTTYYYCVVTNTVAASAGTLSGATASSVAAAVVSEYPTVTTQPADAVINSGQSVTLSARASAGGKLTYQWFSSTNGTSGKIIKGATGADYKLTTIASSVTATTYYYCVITVLDNSMTTGQKAILKTNPAAVTIKAVNAAAPVITAKPISQNVTTGSAAVLSVSATGSGTLSYQWYSNTKNSTSGATLVPGAASASFTIPTSSAGTQYYFCIVTNTDNTMSGAKTASTTSAIAKIIVKNG